MNKLSILYEDNHLLVVDKLAGIATMGAEFGVATVHSLACEYLRAKYQKPGRVFVGIVSRLDTMTSGVLVLARTSKSASRLAPQFAEKAGGGAKKIYLAVVEGDVRPDDKMLIDQVYKDDSAKRMRVAKSDARVPASDLQQANLRYAVVNRIDDATLIAVRLHSGRKHQIRVQFADRGHPVVGDVKYGSRRQFPSGIALHSWRLQIVHPTLREVLDFAADLPKSWRAYTRPVGDLTASWRELENRLEGMNHP